ncbi:hypothetical protein HX776_21905 [Pseudomonas agarici]|uniref:hypothetical protein n=1 Tax=Pseudomonas agarici TaxID=46677 RepID=UPI00035C2711|nr:hypothetical protein [Pseudomonas agarici]NWC11449.1 hypothetical protein [Pseudomonas agarici]SEK98806.1 hypothetical protein SAMN05216604_10979 [Pseudomonas agarici]
MRQEFNPLLALSRYSFTGGAGVILGCFSIVFTALLLMLTYLPSAPIGVQSTVVVLGGVAVVMAFSFAESAILWGHVHWVWFKVAVLVSCLLLSLPTLLYGAPPVLYILGLVTPLLGLLLLNSTSQHAMRRDVVKLRLWRHHQRCAGHAKS